MIIAERKKLFLLPPMPVSVVIPTATPPHPFRRMAMPCGDKSAYTDKQKRKVEHIERGYEKRGVSKETAEKRAWATVNKTDGGGKRKS